MITHWPLHHPKLVKTGEKNEEQPGDSRDPIHFWALVSMDLVSTYDLFSGKIEAGSSPEGCPLNFGPSKMPTFWFFWSQHVPSEIFSVFPKVLSLMSYTYWTIVFLRFILLRFRDTAPQSRDFEPFTRRIFKLWITRGQWRTCFEWFRRLLENISHMMGSF